MRRLLVFGALVLMASLSAFAFEWQEIGGGITIVSDHDTDLPAVVFNTGVSYDETPEMMQLRFTWEVFSVDGGTETMLYEYTKTVRLQDGKHRIWSASQSVLIEPGTQYGARVWIDDIENDLSYFRTYTYIAPESLTIGLRFIGWDGTEEVDLAGLTDAELGDLVGLQRDLSTYEVLAENVDLTDVFSQYATAAASYPVAVILLPETGVDNNWGSESQPITVTFGLSVLVYPVASAEAAAGFLEQVATYEQTFAGTVYAGTADSGFGCGAVIFLHDAMQLILNAAVQEQGTRTE